MPYTETITFDDADGFAPGTATITSQYPRGLVFAIRPTSERGAIQDVTVFVEFPNGVGTRAEADWDAAADAWIARLWEPGGAPAWTPVTVHWRIRDESGAMIDTPPHPAVYADPTRQWYRAESADIVLYWFGLSEDDPDRLASSVLDAVASMRPRREDGFGAPLSYTSTAIVYGSREAIREMTGSGAPNRGYASNQIGLSVLSVADAALDDQIGWLRFVVTHELVHLYQFDVVGGVIGPMWWVEGQANWFAAEPGDYAARLRGLIALQDLPSLTTAISLDVAQADGRADLGYDMGASFIDWLIETQGGIDTHARIVALMAGGTGFYDAVEQATGSAFFDLENGWRISIGLEPFTLADLDPALALEPVAEPVVAIGETVMLPATPALVPLAEAPKPRALASGQCFGGMAVTVVRAGALEGVEYYEVDCMGQIGWLTREQIAGPQD